MMKFVGMVNAYRRQNQTGILIKGGKRDPFSGGKQKSGKYRNGCMLIMVIWFVNLSSRGYKIRNTFASESTYTKCWSRSNFVPCWPWSVSQENFKH